VAELWPPHRVRADRKDVVAPNFSPTASHPIWALSSLQEAEELHLPASRTCEPTKCRTVGPNADAVNKGASAGHSKPDTPSLGELTWRTGKEEWGTGELSTYRI
jgi:hypothetical protein